MGNAVAKNLERITQSVEQHDSNCESKAKAVLLNPFELDRLGFDSIQTKEGRRVPIQGDDSLGTGRLRVVCDGYHGPKKEAEKEEAIEAPSPEERELVPAGMPGPDEVEKLTGYKMTSWQKLFWKGDPNADPLDDIITGAASVIRRSKSLPPLLPSHEYRLES